jgi:hypothetical protein
MKADKKAIIQVQGTAIGIVSRPGGDYISLTDMVRNFDGGVALIEQWLKNKDTVLFLGVWERINNPGFNSLEFEGIRNEAGRNSFFLSAKKWIKQTGAKGLMASAGRYGGTHAHKDIAFEFGSWLSPEFKLHLITEFQRLKEEENNRLKLDWNLPRTLAKINYRIHTDAIKDKRGQQEMSLASTAKIVQKPKKTRLTPISAYASFSAAYLPSLWCKPSSNVAGFLLPGCGRGGGRELH